MAVNSHSQNSNRIGPLAQKLGIAALRIFIILLLLGSMIQFNPTEVSALGNTYYVDNTNLACSDIQGSPGSLTVPYCTIGMGSSKAVNPGDTVWVLAGTYPETVRLNGSGIEGSPITFKGNPGVTITGRNNPDSNDNSAFLFSGRSYIVIDGFTVTQTRGKGIHVLDSHHITISNNHVHHAGDPNDTSLHVQGIVLNDTDYSTVTRNITDHNTCIGIRIINGSDYNTISYNQSFANASVVVRDAAGIELNGASHNVVLKNVTYGNEDSGINVYWNANSLVPSSYNVIVGNLSYGNGDHGIDHNHSPYNTVIGNTLHGNGTVGLNFEGSTAETGSHHAVVYNNIIVANGFTPVSGASGGNIRVDKMSWDGTILDYNIVNREDATVDIIWNGKSYASLNAFRAEVPGQMLHGLEADPLFVDPVTPVLRSDDFPFLGSDVTGDYYLMPGSPAIDRAFSDAPSQQLLDLAENPRVDDPDTDNDGVGTREFDDIGAYEFQPVGDFPASVSTLSVVNVKPTSATVNASITYLGVPNPTQHGVVWATKANPTTADQKTMEGPASATGDYDSTITGLKPHTVYHVRAYATNTEGTVYGDDITFTTLSSLFVPLISR